MKTIVMISAMVGYYAGSYVPVFWGGGGIFSFSSIFFGMIGGFLGIWAGYKIAVRFGL
jgi:hypothetical protein